MRKILALNIFVAILIFGGILFVALDFAFNFTGKLGKQNEPQEAIIVEGGNYKQLNLALADGEVIHSIQSAGDQIVIHVGKPGENGRLMVVSAISAKHRATVTFDGADSTPAAE